MNPLISRTTILERLRKIIAAGKPVIGAGCSAGIIAKCAELGGADLIIVYSTGKSRLMGLPTTRIGHSNPITLGMCEELLNVVKNTPIIGGIEATDPTTMDLRKVLKRFVDVGYSGIINFPTILMFGGYREMREQVGLGFSREVELMRIAREENVFTLAYVFTPEEVIQMVDVGVDCIACHVGGTVGGLAGFQYKDPVERALANVQSMIEAGRKRRSDLICLAHGGPFAEPEDTLRLYQETDSQGFVGASSIERIPIEKAVTNVVRDFKNQSLRKGAYL
jgi:predicted TIM-barrel enzyme